MRAKKLKSTKHADMVMTGDHRGINTVTIATRAQPTHHGVLFRELMLVIGPEAYKTLAVIPAEKAMQVERQGIDLNARVAEAAVRFAANLAIGYAEKLQSHPELGMTLPSYDNLLKVLNSGEFVEGGTIVPLQGKP